MLLIQIWNKPRMRNTHSIEFESFQDHDEELYGRQPVEELHERPPQNSLQDHGSSTDFVKKTFHTISRSRSVASTSNETDPEGKTKIITMLYIKLPHCNGTDNLRVDDSAEANILPLDSFRTIFHALDE